MIMNMWSIIVRILFPIFVSIFAGYIFLITVERIDNDAKEDLDG